MSRSTVAHVSAPYSLRAFREGGLRSLHDRVRSPRRLSSAAKSIAVEPLALDAQLGDRAGQAVRVPLVGGAAQVLAQRLRQTSPSTKSRMVSPRSSLWSTLSRSA